MLGGRGCANQQYPLTQRIALVTAKIRANAEAYCKALWEKQKSIVAQCRQYRAKDATGSKVARLINQDKRLDKDLDSSNN